MARPLPPGLWSRRLAAGADALGTGRGSGHTAVSQAGAAPAPGSSVSGQGCKQVQNTEPSWCAQGDQGRVRCEATHGRAPPAPRVRSSPAEVLDRPNRRLDLSSGRPEEVP